jgi:glycerol uptake facilitator-like aquaporin
MDGARFWQKLLAEAVGTAFLLAAIVGSGIMGERLAGGNIAIALLANSVATGAALVALILALDQFPALILIRRLLWRAR